uniref:Aldehyde dehydrogenase domain-containing protein n=1 Tax=Panagrolaimus sp. ES5 TaxID=591445 RepID=A0AC34GXY5_9BILA
MKVLVEMETDSNTLPIFIDTCDLETKALDQCGNQSKDFITKSKLLKASILKNVKTLHHILSEIQPYKVTTFEIEHSVKTLDMININAGFFYKKVDYISVFMPSNLPLYSFILFGIVPSFMTNKKLFIKPNQLMREKGIFAKVCAILNVQQLFKNVEIINHETSKFINEYVPASDVIIFTGYNKNRDKILSLIKPGSLLIYNGSGHNPFVIGRNANIEKAAKDACYAKFFNSGQDCAGPDAILVHESIFHDFMQMYLMEVEKLKIGKYDDQNVDVGPITRKSELQKFLDLLHANDADNVKIGGVIGMFYDNRR